MIDFFMTKSYGVYVKSVKPQGAGETTSFEKRATVKAYIEPFSGETLQGSPEGDRADISLAMYSRQQIYNGEKVYIPEVPYKSLASNKGWFEIRQVEFYDMPYMSYFKGYLVKADENIRI